MVSRHENFSDFLVNFIVIGAASSVAKTITAPLDRIKLILQNQKSALHIISGELKQYQSLYDCMVRIPSEQGFLSFWRGNGTNVLRYIPTQILNFACNDFYKTELIKYQQQTPIIAFIAGGLSGFTSALAVYPLKFCQTRISLDMGPAEVSGVTRQYTGLTDCLNKIVQREGYRALYRGGTLAIVSSGIYHSLYFGLFDSLKHSYQYHQVESEALKYHNSKTPIWVEFVIAQFGTLFSALVVYPLDTTGRRYALDSGRENKLRDFPGPWRALKIIWVKEGFRSFYRGGFTNCLHGICGALILVFYEEFLYYNTKPCRESRE